MWGKLAGTGLASPGFSSLPHGEDFVEKGRPEGLGLGAWGTAVRHLDSLREENKEPSSRQNADAG